MTTDLTNGIVRILDPTGDTVGAGFILTGDGLIATCAHVIESAGAGPDETVRLAFHHTGDEATATVEPDGWRESQAEDVAILRLSGSLPDKITPLPLGSSGMTAGRAFHTFGFPEANPDEGVVGKAEVVGRTTMAGYPVLQLRSIEITSGFSGAPIWDDDLQVVIGMAVSITRPDRYGRMTGTAFIIPVETIRQICPALQLPDICPYRGLNVFEVKDAEHYFGRERATEELLRKLNEQKFVAVVGVSGSGKSSLVRAGLAKGLQTSPILGLVERPRCLFMPGRAPLLNLLLALTDLPGQTSERIARLFNLPPEALTNTSETRHQAQQALMAQSPRSLAKLLQSHFRAEELLLIVDQFERLYTECQNERVRRWFIETLLYTASDEVKVLLTIRADFYGLALAHPTLSQAIKNSQMTLLPMNRGELRRAIVEPARLLNRTFQPGLVERLLADAQGRAGDLPLLEFALTELWERDAQQSVLTMTSYEGLRYVTSSQRQISGIQGAVAQRAEAIWKTLNDVERTAVRRIFLGLVSPGSLDEQGIQIVKDASRRAWQTELDEPARQMAEKLVSARLLTMGQDPATQHPTVEVAHEALIRAWPRLQQWIREYRPFIHWRNHDLAPLLNGWQAKEKHSDFLLPESMLDDAQSYLKKYSAELSGAAEEYIQASAQRWKQQKRRRMLITASTLMVVVVLALVAGIFWRRGESDRVIARQSQAAQAASQDAIFIAANQFEPALLLSLEANRVIDEYEIDLPEARDSLLRVLQTNPYLTTIIRSPIFEAQAMALSPDGQIIAYSGDIEGNIALWDVTRRQPLGRPLLGHINPIFSLAFSPDGQIIASSNCRIPLGAAGDCNKSEIRLWNIRTREVIQHLVGHTGHIYDIAFSPDGQMLASGSRDNTIILWNLETGQQMAKLNYNDEVQSVAFSPDDHLLASGSQDGLVILWDVETRQPAGQALAGHTASVRSVVFKADGKILASASEDGTVILWDVETRQPIHQPLKGHSDEVRNVAFSPNGQILASSSLDTTIILWDVTSGQPLGGPLTGHAGAVNYIAFSPDGQTLVSSSHDGSIILWDIASYYPQSNQPLLSRLAELFDSQLDDISSLAASPDGQTLALGSHNGTIILWNVANHQPMGQPLTDHTGQVYSLSFNPDGQRLASSSADSTIILWDVKTDQPLAQPLAGHTATVLSVAFSPDGHLLASGGDDGTIILWDMNTRRPLSQPLTGHSGSVNSLVFSPDGQILASGSSDDTIILWDITKRQPIDGYPHPNYTQGVLSLAFSPDGQTLTASGYTDEIILWDISTRSMHKLVGHENRINSLAFSPNGQMLASTSLDKTFILWDVAAAQKIGSPFRFDASIRSGIAFSPDGRIVVSGDDEGHIILWDVAPTLWREHACQLAARNLTWEEWNQYFPGQEYAKTCPNLPAHDTVVVEMVGRATLAGDASRYGQTLEWAREIGDASLNNYVCSFGSYAKFKKSVPFCEEMVELDPNNGRLRGSRGLARAILGDNDADVIADLEAAIAWYRQNEVSSCIALREDLIKWLKAREHPFDEQTLQALWDENC